MHGKKEQTTRRNQTHTVQTKSQGLRTERRKNHCHQIQAKCETAGTAHRAFQTAITPGVKYGSKCRGNIFGAILKLTHFSHGFAEDLWFLPGSIAELQKGTVLL